VDTYLDVADPGLLAQLEGTNGKHSDNAINNTSVTSRADGYVGHTSPYGETRSVALEMMRNEEQ
jgi:hypothetical protein